MTKTNKTNEIPAFDISDVMSIMNHCDTLRLCVKLSTQTSIMLHQNKRACDRAIKQYNEDLEMLREKHGDDEKALNKAYNDLTKKGIQIPELHILDASKFPKEREEFGTREQQTQTHKGDLMVNKIHYFDSFVVLLTSGIITSSEEE